MTSRVPVSTRRRAAFTDPMTSSEALPHWKYSLLVVGGRGDMLRGGEVNVECFSLSVPLSRQRPQSHDSDRDDDVDAWSVDSGRADDTSPTVCVRPCLRLLADVRLSHRVGLHCRVVCYVLD
jgi:hypothetical protein